MTLYESRDSSGVVSLKDICNGKIDSKLTGEMNLRNLANYVVRRSFPGSIQLTAEEAQYSAKSYIELILNNDIQRIDDRKYDVNKMRLLLRSLARNESTTSTKKQHANDIKEIDEQTIDLDTITTYLDVFKCLYLIKNQEPFSSNIRSSVRIKQAKKRHLCDHHLHVLS